jgi:hypothetical protein
MQGKVVAPKTANGMRKGPENGHSTKGAVKHKEQSPPPKPHKGGSPRKFSL